jgi:hypothetical protein
MLVGKTKKAAPVLAGAAESKYYSGVVEWAILVPSRPLIQASLVIKVDRGI